MKLFTDEFESQIFCHAEYMKTRGYNKRYIINEVDSSVKNLVHAKMNEIKQHLLQIVCDNGIAA